MHACKQSEHNSLERVTAWCEEAVETFIEHIVRYRGFDRGVMADEVEEILLPSRRSRLHRPWYGRLTTLGPQTCLRMHADEIHSERRRLRRVA